jgi:3-methyl-2-oxobutanoate hydroxymethyltransferase
MSLVAERHPSGLLSSAKVTFPALLEKKRVHSPITALTACDYTSGRIVDEAGIDLILVGDSLGMVALGYESTLPVTIEEMLHHTRAVRRAVHRALLLADMPFGTYQVDEAEAVRNAIRFVKEAGAEGVKIEGARPSLARRLLAAEIPVVAHIGLLPQGINRMGGYRVQGRTVDAAERLLAEALSMEEAGAVMIVLEGVPDEVAAQITETVNVPTIGIGAGSQCDGQILVLHDILNLSFTTPAKFVRRYADLGAQMHQAISEYSIDVRKGRFPSKEESYHLAPEVRAAFFDAIGKRSSEQIETDAVGGPLSENLAELRR